MRVHSIQVFQTMAPLHRAGVTARLSFAAEKHFPRFKGGLRLKCYRPMWRHSTRQALDYSASMVRQKPDSRTPIHTTLLEDLQDVTIGL